MKAKKDFAARRIPYLLVLIALLIPGCASDRTSVDEIARIPKDYSLVFGRIESPFNGSVYVFVKGDKSRKAIRAQIHDDGYFFWQLKPDKYTITHFNRRGFFGETVAAAGRIWVTFEVKNDSPITYIGTLVLVPAGAVSKTNIRNNMERARERLKEKFNLEDQTISVNLMKAENF